MIEGKFEAILNRKVDGMISPEEEAELQEYLATHPEAHSYAEDLDGLCRTLRTVKEIDPPDDLRDAILERIRAAPAPTVHEATVDLPDEGDGWLASLVQTLRGWMRPQLAYSFAAGTAVGVLLFAVFTGNLTQSRLDETSLPGAMMPVEGSAFSQIDSALLQLEDTQMRFETRRHENQVLGEIRVESGPSVQIVLEFDGATLSPLGFWREQGSTERIEFETGRIRIAHQGANTYQVLLTEASTTAGVLTVRLAADDGVVERTLRLRP
ncbi:MAG: hypothetical protein JSW67_13590 [Candidatus Latescibacterota bacterium]|nr:MAG: hypothetical protein JSW67_13590 [Candidatus Latescibacterota bacterium]